MADLHEALKRLNPVDWSDIPVNDLPAFLREHFDQAELIVNSVPPVPGGDDYKHSSHSFPHVNGATSASEIISSHARAPYADAAMQDLAKGWGKPVKLGKTENQLGVNIYKMAGRDKHGAWFARRSVHEGLGFTKFKTALQNEFPTSLEVHKGPGSGSVRGIGGDRLLERHEVDKVGKLEVYELSAKFPPPTSPRDFVTLLLTSDTALTTKSAVASEKGQGPNVIPRHWMVVSIPVEHPDAPARQGLVRGKYESVEMIREIPLARPKSQSTPDLTQHMDEAENSASLTHSNITPPKNADVEDDAELNPVEWIMVTRSDPGGGIPRFLVDRGTPPSIASDMVKFLDWACAAKDLHTPPSHSTVNAQERRESYSTRNQRLTAGVHEDAGSSSFMTDDSTATTSTVDSEKQAPNGVLYQVTSAIGGGVQALGEGVGRLTPDVISQNLPGRSRQVADECSDSDTSTATSGDSFASAEPYYTADPGEHDRSPTQPTSRAHGEEEAGQECSDERSLNSTGKRSDRPAAQHTEDILARFDAKRRHLHEKFTHSREKLDRDSQNAMAKTTDDADKHRSRHERELRKQQERHDRETKKLEARAAKEERKIESRRRKDEQKDQLLRTSRERDELRERLEHAEHENKVLREQLGEVQRENTKLVAKMGKIDQGPDALKQVWEQMRQEKGSRGRSGTVNTVQSTATLGEDESGHVSEAATAQAQD